MGNYLTLFLLLLFFLLLLQNTRIGRPTKVTDRMLLKDVDVKDILRYSLLLVFQF